jgi:hypothetical protein
MGPGTACTVVTTNRLIALATRLLQTPELHTKCPERSLSTHPMDFHWAVQILVANIAEIGAA